MALRNDIQLPTEDEILTALDPFTPNFREWQDFERKRFAREIIERIHHAETVVANKKDEEEEMRITRKMAENAIVRTDYYIPRYSFRGHILNREIHDAVRISINGPVCEEEHDFEMVWKLDSFWMPGSHNESGGNVKYHYPCMRRFVDGIPMDASLCAKDPCDYIRVVAVREKGGTWITEWEKNDGRTD